MTTKALFSELLSDSHSERWNEFELPKLSLGELQALCKLLGFWKNALKSDQSSFEKLPAILDPLQIRFSKANASRPGVVNR